MCSDEGACANQTVKDACDTMADINAIAWELEFDEPQTEAATICGYQIPRPYFIAMPQPATQ